MRRSPSPTRLGLIQVRDEDALIGWIDEVVAAHPAEVARFRGGETKLTGFFVGQVMKRSAGKADPKAIQPILLAAAWRVTEVAPVDAIRAAFPALQRRHAGRPVAYFDGPGGTQVPQAVVDAMADYLLHHNANTHWRYPTSEETDVMLDDARRVFAQFLGGAPEEISFGNNMTTITFHVARALGRDWRDGDEVIVTELDHHGNVAPWQALARERGIVLRWLPIDTHTCQLHLDALASLLGPPDPPAGNRCGVEHRRHRVGRGQGCRHGSRCRRTGICRWRPLCAAFPA